MRPTEELKQEHRVIERMLRTLIVASKRVQNGGEVDPQVFHKSVDFIRNFADKCHHGKEESNLFPAIEKQGFPREGGPIGMMLVEHDEGRAHVRELASALQKLELGDASPAVKTAISRHALGYARLLAQHIEKEDKILYDIADHAIPPAEQVKLITIFADVEEQTIGRAKHAEYARLAEKLETALEAQGVRL